MKNRLIIAFLLLTHWAYGQSSAGILDPTRAIDWSTAGVTGGVPSSTWTQCGSTIASGASFATIQTAINNCTPGSLPANGKYVLLGAGTFTGTGGLVLKSGVVVRGQGANQTTISSTGGGASCYSGGAVFCFNNGVGDYNGSAAVQPGGSQAANWTAGFARGATSITLATVGSSGIINGQYIFLDQANDTTVQSGYFNCETTSCTTEGGSPGRTISGVVHSQLQVVKVTAGCTVKCSGAGPFTVTISPGLYGSNWTSGRAPGAWWPSGMVQYAGVEDLKIDTTSSSVEQSIGIFNASDSWVSGVSFITTPRAGIWIIQGAHNTARNNYTYSTQSKASLGYGVEEDLTSDNLAVNNIMQQTVSPIMTGSAFGNVFAYNFQVNDFQTACASCMYLSTAAHDAAASYNLWEGNYASGVDMDVVHGTGGIITLYRNVFAGFELGKSAYTMAAIIDPYNRYENIVGNVLGTPGKTTTYSVSDPSGNGGVYSVGNAHASVGFDSVVGQTLLRWANYDNVTGAVRFCGNSSDTGWATTCSSTSEVPTTGLPNGNAYANAVPTLGDTGIGQSAMPASFIYASAPSWWPAGKPFPPIGPDVTNGNTGQCTGTGSYPNIFATSAGQCTGSGATFTAHINAGHMNSIPAMDCFFSMGGPPDGSGSALTFNAATCYTTSAAPTVSLTPPTLIFAAQAVGTTSASQPVTLSNTGTATLTISNITVSGDFAQTNNCGGSLNAGTSCTINVTFTPTQSGGRTGTLSVTDNATGSPHTVAVSGTGSATTTASFTPPTLDFGGVVVGVTSPLLTATLTNTGVNVLNVTNFQITTFTYDSTTCGATLAAGASCLVRIKFTPSQLGAASGTLTANNDATNAPQTISVSGTGISAVNVIGGSGTGTFSVGPVIAVAPAGYSARTDNCWSGAESGCVAGRTTGKAGSAMSFTGAPTDTVPFSEMAAANTAATDPDFGSYMVLVTDTSTNNSTSSFNMGSNGEWDAFNTDSSLFLVSQNGGSAFLYYIDKAKFQAHTCSPSNACVIKTQIRTGAACTPSPTCTDAYLKSQGDWSFSRKAGEANVIYEEDSTGVIINKLVVNRSGDPSTWTVTRSRYVDFTSDTPTACSVLPADYVAGWSGVFAPGNDGSITKAYGGGSPWVANHTYSANSFIYPANNNSGHKGFWTALGGTSGSTEVTWSTSCNTTGNTCPADGTVNDWVNVGNLASQGPGFDIVNYRPGNGCSRINTRTGVITRGTGNALPTGTWTTTDQIICARLGTTPPCTLTDRMTLHEAGQPFDSHYVTISPTGQGATSCIIPGACSCAATNANYKGPWSSSVAYVKNDLVIDDQTYWQAGAAVAAGHAAPHLNATDWGNRGDSDAYCYGYTWQVDSTVVNPCMSFGHCSGHSAKGTKYYYRGSQLYSHSYATPSLPTRDGQGNITGAVDNPGVPMLPTALPADHHTSGRNTDSEDSQPILFAQTEVPMASSRYAYGYNEVLGIKPDGSQAGTGCSVSGTACGYRFAHNFNTGSESDFSGQNAIALISQDGTMAAVTTDMMGTRGSKVTGGSSCNKLRADLGPAKSQSITSGQKILPVTNNPNFSIFQAQNSGTESAVALPDWNTCSNVNDTCVDGTVTFKNIGINDCRPDIVLIDLLSAHPQP